MQNIFHKHWDIIVLYLSCKKSFNIYIVVIDNFFKNKIKWNHVELRLDVLRPALVGCTVFLIFLDGCSSCLVHHSVYNWCIIVHHNVKINRIKIRYIHCIIIYKYTESKLCKFSTSQCINIDIVMLLICCINMYKSTASECI